MGLISSVDSRLALMNARKKLAKLAKRYKRKIDWQTTRLSQSYLRLEVTLDPFATSYNFPVLVNENGGQAGKKEVRLNLQDTFFVSHVGFFINIDSANYTAYDANGADLLSNTLYTCPSTEWNANGSNQFVLERCRKIWQSTMKLTVDQRVICIAWDVDRNYNVPTYQRPYFGGVVPTQGYNYTDARDGSADGFYPCEPMWLLSGSKNNQLNWQLPESIGSAIGSTPSFPVVKAVLVFRGVLAQNSTSIF